MVFQSYALLPHMTVAENIAFPLRMRGMAKAAQAAAVVRVLDLVGLAAFGDRRPMQLSGGQQQRVALARAIVFEPPVLLMDEPPGALDKHLRAHLQSEIKRIQTRLGLAVLHLTHDQEEALTLSARICVMHDGAILQTVAPETLHDRRADIYVAGFFGDSNRLAAEAGPGGGLQAAGTFAPWRGCPRGRSPSPSGPNASPSPSPATPDRVETLGVVREAVFVGDSRRCRVGVAGGRDARGARAADRARPRSRPPARRRG